MKKILSLFTLFLASFTLIGCEFTTDDPSPESHTVILASDNTDASLTQDPEGPHEEGDEVEVSASWDEETYSFLRWEEDGETVSEEPTFTYTVDGDATLDAVFEETPQEPETYDITLNSDYADATLSQTPEGPHENGDIVEISATWSDDYYEFVRWEEDGVSVSEAATFDYTVDGDATLDAVFEETPPEPETFDITLNSDYADASLTQDPEGPHENGDTIEISATWSDDNYEFVRWEEDGESVSETATFDYTVDGDATLDAVFEETPPEPETFDITLNSDYADATLAQDPEGPHESGDTVEISATWSDDNYEFVRWEEDGVSVSETATFDYTVDGDATLDAVFEEVPETFDITLNSDYADATLAQDPEGPHENGDTVEISATWSDDNYEFVRWEEDGVSVSEAATFDYMVDGDATLEAVFEEGSTAEPATYTETFDNLSVSGSTYETGTFTGVNGIEWTYSDVRGDKNIDGSKAATLSNVTSDRDPYISATIPEGIKSFSVEYINPFTSPAQLELVINGQSVGVSDEVDGSVGIFEVNDIDVSGTFDMELRPLDGQTTLDNLTWDNFVEGSDDPEVTLTSNYWDADLSVSPSDKEPVGTDVTVNASDPHGDYAFLRWEDSAGNTITQDADYTFTLQENKELHAVFDSPERVELTLDSNLYRADLSMDQSMPVVPGTEVTVSASDPEDAYDFLGWETENGTQLNSDETFTYTVDENETIHAIYDVEETYDYETMTLDELTDLDLSTEYDSLEGLYGDELRTAMQDLIDDVNLQTYGDARTILADTDEDPQDSDNIILFYTRQSVDGGWDGGTWNREHIWPQSLMPVEADNPDANMASDLHALVPTNEGENSSRGNQHYTMEGEGGYEPHDDVKGDASRMLFYMDVMYDDLTLVDGEPAEGSYEMGDLSTILEWHVSDEISDYEKNRNDVVESHQGNRNPFIDYPHLAYLIHYDHPEVGLD